MSHQDIYKLHIVLGDSAAGSLVHALDLPRDRILTAKGSLVDGPVPSINNVADWQTLHEAFMGKLSLENIAHLNKNFERHAHLNVEKLRDAETVVVWAGLSLSEQLFVSWVIHLFETLELDLSKLLKSHPGKEQQKFSYFGILSCTDIQKLPLPRNFSTGELKEYRRTWRAFTSSDPADHIKIMKRKFENEDLGMAVKQLLYRFPSAHTGLPLQDENLLRSVLQKGPIAASIIGETMSKADIFDSPSDSNLMFRLNKLADAELPKPLVQLSGDCLQIRYCHVELTDFGQLVLDGSKSALEINGIDDWIGGVHLTDAATAPLRHGDRLLMSA